MLLRYYKLPTNKIWRTFRVKTKSRYILYICSLVKCGIFTDQWAYYLNFSIIIFIEFYKIFLLLFCLQHHEFGILIQHNHFCLANILCPFKTVTILQSRTSYRTYLGLILSYLIYLTSTNMDTSS